MTGHARRHAVPGNLRRTTGGRRLSPVLGDTGRGVDELAARYGALLRQRGYSEATIDRRLILLRSVGGAKMTSATCRRTLDGPSAPETRRQYYSQLRRVIADLIELGELHEDPMAGFLSPQKSRYRPRPLPVDDVKRLLSQPGRFGEWSALGYYAALRRGEVAQVDAGNLRHERHGWTLTVVGKGGKQETIPAHPRVVEVLHKYPAGRPPWAVTAGHIGLVWASVASDLLGRRVTFHQMRHSGITAFYEASGYDLITTSRFARHSRIETTMTYADVADAQMFATVAGL